jgi:hypothetical protein
MELPPETAQTEIKSVETQDSYVKLAMRNMVRKGGTSLKHFLLTSIGLLLFLIIVSYFTR